MIVAGIFEVQLAAHDVEVEDGGMAKYVQVTDQPGQDVNPERGLFVRIHSWDDDGRHPEFDSLVGKRVRVTIEAWD